MTSPTDLATLKIDDCAPHRDAVFEVQSPAGMMPLKLGHLATRRAHSASIEMGPKRLSYLCRPRAGERPPAREARTMDGCDLWLA